MLTTLNYGDEIRDQESLGKFGERPDFGSEDFSLAKMMVSKMEWERFDMSDFRNSLTERLKSALKEKEREGK